MQVHFTFASKLHVFLCADGSLCSCCDFRSFCNHSPDRHKQVWKEHTASPQCIVLLSTCAGVACGVLAAMQLDRDLVVGCCCCSCCQSHAPATCTSGVHCTRCLCQSARLPCQVQQGLSTETCSITCTLCIHMQSVISICSPLLTNSAVADAWNQTTSTSTALDRALPAPSSDSWKMAHCSTHALASVLAGGLPPMETQLS